MKYHVSVYSCLSPEEQRNTWTYSVHTLHGVLKSYEIKSLNANSILHAVRFYMKKSR